jgi:hypothetical protein
MSHSIRGTERKSGKSSLPNVESGSASRFTLPGMHLLHDSYSAPIPNEVVAKGCWQIAGSTGAAFMHCKGSVHLDRSFRVEPFSYPPTRPQASRVSPINCLRHQKIPATAPVMATEDAI